jgi:heme-degrading monooxygenase HmoA
MAWGFISELPLSRDDYDRLNGEIHDDPEGLILHTASEKGGGMRIVDVWESEDAYRRFEQETLFPALGRIGADTSGGPPPLDAFEVHNMRGRAS